MAQNDLDKATHSLNGEFTVNDTNSELVVQLIVSLKDSSGKEVNGFRAKVEAVEVSDREEITKTLGLTVDITPEKSKSVDNKPTEQILADRESKLAESAKTPTVAITNSQPSTPVNASAGGTTTTTASPDANGVKQTIIAPSLTSKFKIEVLVKNPLNEYVPTPASDVNGLAVVGLNEKDIYGVRIYNDFDFDVAVKLTLDGVNSLALSENPDFRRMGCWIIPKKDSGIVKGWHKNNNETQDFLVTSYPESVAKQLGGVAEGIGVIQAQFFPAWTGNDRPYVELAGIQKGDGAGGLGTGAGLKSNVKSESVTRFIGQSLLGAITVRYARPEVPKDLPTDAPPSK